MSALVRWNRIIDVWRSGQVQLPKVIRWSRFSKRAEPIREQNCLQHSYSLTVLVNIIIVKLSSFIALDESLLQRAALVHDHGEGELQSDVPYTQKTNEDDIHEYEAFCRRYGVLDRRSFEHFHRAFLLQFVAKPEAVAKLPKDAREIIGDLAQTRADEALLFSALERWDYVLYAIEQHQHLGNEFILAEVLGNQMPELDEYARRIPGFSQEIWTPGIRAWCVRFLAEYCQARLPKLAQA